MPASNLNIDFSNVAEGGNFRPKHKEEGEYTGKIIKVEDDQSKAGDARWTFTIQIDGDSRSTYPYYCAHDPKQFWKIRAILVAAGITVPKRKVAVNPNKVVGKAVGVILEDNEFNDRLSSAIAELIPLADIQDPLNDEKPQRRTARKAAAPVEDEYDDEDVADEEEEVAPPPRKRTAKRAPEPEPEDDEDEDEEPAPAPRRRRAAAPAEEPAPRKRAAAKRAPAPAEDDDLELDDDEDEAPAPPPRKRAAKRAPARAAAQDDEDDDLDEL